MALSDQVAKMESRLAAAEGILLSLGWTRTQGGWNAPSGAIADDEALAAIIRLSDDLRSVHEAELATVKQQTVRAMQRLGRGGVSWESISPEEVEKERRRIAQ